MLVAVSWLFSLSVILFTGPLLVVLLDCGLLLLLLRVRVCFCVV